MKLVVALIIVRYAGDTYGMHLKYVFPDLNQFLEYLD